MYIYYISTSPLKFILQTSFLNSLLAGCFSKDQVYLDGILKILRYRDKINFPLLMALGKVIQLSFLCLLILVSLVIHSAVGCPRAVRYRHLDSATMSLSWGHLLHNIGMPAAKVCSSED